MHNYADKVRAILAKRRMHGKAPVTGMLPGTPPTNPKKDNMKINARSGEFVIDQPTVEHFGPQTFENMQQQAHAAQGQPLSAVEPPSLGPRPKSAGYFGGGHVGRGGGWRGRSWGENYGWEGGPQIFFPGYQPRDTTQFYPPDLPPITAPDYTPSPVQGLPQKKQNYEGGLVEKDHYWRGGRVRGEGYDPSNYGSGFDRDTIHQTLFNVPGPHGWGAPSASVGGGDVDRWSGRFGNPWFNQAGPNTLGNIGPPNSGWFNQGPTMLPTTLGNSGYPMALPVMGQDYMPSTGIQGLPGKKES